MMSPVYPFNYTWPRELNGWDIGLVPDPISWSEFNLMNMVLTQD